LAYFGYLFININVQVRYYKDLSPASSTYFLPYLTGNSKGYVCFEN